MSKKGITKITIPVRQEEVSIEVINKYLESIYTLFEQNSIKIKQDYDRYCLDHKILSKRRVHDDTETNNIVLIPDLKAMVDWKTGYVFGNPIKYAQNKTIDTDDIEYLNKYVRNACQRSIDKEVGKWAYATGVGYYFIEPKSNDFDIEVEAPYELYCRDADTCTKVYSSYGAKKPLFDILYTTYEDFTEQGHNKIVKVLDVYTSTTLYTFEKRDMQKFLLVNQQERGIYQHLPLVEKRFNTDGIGIVAMGETMQEALDKLASNGLDNVDDIVNEIFVYKNVNLGATTDEQKRNHSAMKRNGAVVLNTPSGSTAEADLDTIAPKLSLSEIREMFALLNAKFHSSVGVPMEISDTNSGGTTKQGSEVSNGYDNAYNRAIDDINTFLFADTELLEKIMWICKNTANNKINNLAPSEIEIKYSLNLTDNMLTKSQSYGTFIQTMPPAMALRYCRLSNDPEAEGKLIEDYMERKEQKAQQTQVTNSQE